MGLYRKTVCRCLVHRPHYSARLTRFGSRGPSEFFSSDTPPKCLHRDCVGRRQTGTRHGNVYVSVREKQGIVVYRQRVLQTVTSGSECCFTIISRQDLLKIANFNPQKDDFRYGKKIRSPRERRKWSQHLTRPSQELA